ncbi:hypothetical protein [Kaistella jeonii]|uniref:Lipoprotein n=1 Tax=Kaistella jeonii TaxID=266749 RepID=A0A0C1CY84_9FLAO|nr:hypothetical protein [Kaistella jeonii]KIA89346.1 hypothetical protein OA86_07055 [Kaistella jeonii]SFC03376.1 hypothetical protein SAMN05421876_105136 [Kaistella jeonii]VEI96667.1 Uncharacterised protein [Kaistella jeonii]
MKNLFFIATVAFFAFLSCRNDDRAVQQIDQILNIYIDSAGQDMLNSKIKGSYITIRWNDINGLTDTAPVSFNNNKDADTLNYMEYLAGAKRIAIDSSGSSKTYESKINLFLTKRINDSTTSTGKDLMVIHYTSTPELFQVSSIWYNNILKFTKVQGQPNIVKITK